MCALILGLSNKFQPFAVLKYSHLLDERIFFANQKFKIATRMCGVGHLNSKMSRFFFCKSHAHFNGFTKVQEIGARGVDFRIKMILLIEITY